MKNLFVLLILLCTSYVLLAQTQNVSTIKGKTIDSISGNILSNVNLQIVQASDKKTVAKLSTDDNGNFMVKLQKGIKYNIMFSLMSYETRYDEIYVSNDSKDSITYIGEIPLSPKAFNLKVAEIVGIRHLVKQEIDRISYSVKDDPDNKFESTLDMMKKVPLLSVDGMDNIEFKGSRSFKILINGKVSGLFTSDPSLALKSIPASSVDRIEVITNPPSKYDAEGLTGLINIVTKRRTVDGYSGNVGVAYNFPYGPMGRLSTTYKSGKFGVDLFGSIFRQKQPATDYGNTTKSNLFNTQLDQKGQQRYNGNAISLGGQLNFEIDTLNLLTLSLSSNINTFDQYVTLESHLSNRNGEIEQAYGLNQTGQPRWRSTDLDLNYQLGFKRSKDQLLTLSYKFARSNNDVEDIVTYDYRRNIQDNDFNQFNNFGLDEHSLQADYAHPFKKLKMEAGGKIIFRDNKSRYAKSVFDSIENYLENNFNYSHTIYNLYNSYEYSMKNWAFKGGLRLDATRLLENEEHKNGELFLKVLPSISIQKVLKKGTLGFAFNQRIQRPNIMELNPFVNVSNPRLVFSGNPSLRPVVGESYELSYSYFNKGSLYVSLGYSHIGNNIEKVVDFLSDTIINNTYANIGKNENYSLNVSASKPITNKIQLSFNGMLSYVNIRGEYIDQSFQNDGFRTSLRLSSTYQITDDLRSGLNLNYTSPVFYLQGKSNAYPTFSMNISKQFFKKKLSVFASVNNPFAKYFNIKNNNNTPEFAQNSFSQVYYRTFVLNVSYSFGKLKESLKRAKKSIKNEDIAPIEIKLTK
jgi:hypothetical protein